MENKSLQQEWLYQQKAYDKYEQSALMIKLFSFATFLALILTDINWCIGLALLAMLWLSEGIWKTFQSRIESRLMVLESAIRKGEHELAFQYNSDFNQQRGGAIKLVVEYAKQSLKPTVMFPHFLLCGLYVIGHLFT